MRFIILVETNPVRLLEKQENVFARRRSRRSNPSKLRNYGLLRSARNDEGGILIHPVVATMSDSAKGGSL
jgi:hypothetical protein